jgi:hypothetical protein
MPIAVIMDFKGATLDQYDQVVASMPFTAGGPGIAGGLFHWVAKTDDGFRIVDVWEDRETFDRFVEEQMMPGAQRVGFSGPPEMTFYEVHNYFTAGDGHTTA